MDQNLTIGRVARQSGLSVPSIRFYEAQGIIPAPRRTDAGYRLYASNDVRRLRLARRARLLGLSLPEVKELVERAFASECGTYAREILHLVATQRARIDRQIAELLALRGELDSLEEDARRISADVPAGLTVAECGRCLLMDGESGEQGFCRCGSTSRVITLESMVGDKMGGDETVGDETGGDKVSTPLAPDVVDALVCEIGKRPHGAPAIGEVIGSVTSFHREGDSLVVEFDPAAAEKVQAVVDAERQCCSTIGWQLELGQGIRLRITALPLQLETLEAMFSPPPSAAS